MSVAACENPVACENAKPGSAPSTWQVDGAGSSTIQGYATTMSVNKGETIRFRVKTPSTSYHIDIFRLGYYGGNGARLQAGGIRPTATLPQTQPACITTAATGLIDCGNWALSASWAVPADAVSGVYIALLKRDDASGASQIPFVVRDDASNSQMLLRTSDSTWQAYNSYGGNSLYACTVSCPPGNPKTYKAAFSVSYNRPFDGTLPQDGGRSYLFYAEYQFIRFVERNGFDVSYTSQADVASNPARLLDHRLIISSGHDEYWSGPERNNVEAARDAGVNLAFFSGNEVFWKTRWSTSALDGGANRTLTSYKDTHFDAPTDPVAWTGTWRDPRYTPPADGGRPENALTGQLFIINSGSSDIKVPAAYKNFRLWRNTAVANLTAGQTRTLAPGANTLGYEWDVDTDNGFRPKGAIQLSSTTVSGVESFTDYGSSTQLNTTQTHHLMLYRAASGALVFGAGTVQWAWGLDTTNAWNANGAPAAATPDPVMQQATVNLFTDMGVPATTLMSGLIAVTASTDTTAPTSTITSPAPGATIADGTAVTITGTASDSGGTVAGVEVSTNGGATWHPATGTTSWSYSWVAHGAPTTTILTRSSDDSANLETPSAGVTVTIGCPCTMLGSTVPTIVDENDPNGVSVGVRFKADLDGTITGVRFYKAAANTGTHVGQLWTSGGTLLASGTFGSETSSGWQVLSFATPVAVTAGTTYVASYHAPRGHYSVTLDDFYMPSPVGGNVLDSAPLRPLGANGGTLNGVYTYSGTPGFPVSNGSGENYSVDVLFVPKLPPGPVSLVTATAGPGQATVNFLAPASGGSPSRYTVTPYVGTTAQTPVVVDGTPPPTSILVGNLDPGISYTFKVTASNGSGSSPASAASNAITPNAPTVPGAPTGLVAGVANASATVRWTAPADGGRTITRYTITPYLAGVAKPSTTVTGSPAPTSAVVPDLLNGSSYTFKVTATNAVGDGPESAASNAVTPNPAPRFIQQVSGRNPSGSTLALTPPSAITAGDRLVVLAGVWSSGNAKISGVTDAAGNTYTKLTSIVASEATELSVWTAPITAGGGTRPAITVTATGGADIGAAALQYSGLSSAAGLGSVDALKTATGTSVAADYVTSGPTPTLTGDNELAVGFYVDSGFGRALGADPQFTQRVNVSPTSDMEFLVEDTTVGRFDVPAARVMTGPSIPWSMATVVFKSGVPAPPALGVSPTSVSFAGTVGATSPAAKTLSITNPGGGTLSWSASESASWLGLSPSSGTNAGTITLTPDVTGLAAGTYTTDVTVTAPGATGAPATIPVTFTVTAPVPPALSVAPTSLAFSATAGGAAPAAKTLAVSNTGGGTLSWTTSDDASWLTVTPGSGSGAGTVTVTPSITGLDPGAYTATVTVAASGATGSPASIPVTLTVAAPTPPALAVTPTTLAFSATVGQASPAAKTVAVSNTGSGALDVSAADDAAWLTVTPATATAPATLTVTPNSTGLAVGTYSATVTVTATTAGATGSPKTIGVTLTVAAAPTSLVGAWGFDEASGATAQDASGRGNVGTIDGATRSPSGKFGGALSFDGVNDLVTVADANSLDLTTGMTMEAWIRPTAIGGLWRSVMIKEQPSNLIYALYADDSGGKPAAHIFTTADKGSSGAAATVANAWTHLAATYDGANVRIYVNGVLSSTKAITGAIKVSTGALRIGGNSIWGEWFTGLIDEVRLYNRALTVAELQADMAAPINPA
ncbi:DUF4082 domain-containing protein [Solirubrobacter ginsenosidimutans]|uniref:DUF4082 domain-containing protein n=1 Tax=Solirubrobacter ginsenosidimutans TaxID=490573 RepID=A0A9X3MUJ5_9ACTN|nr:DUF4082 domain-containing protein [Solirubrobacter ginsenosidimutans]